MILGERRNEKIQITLPTEFVGMWTANGGLYEFRANGRYYIHGTSPYELRDSGQTLFYGSEYSRKFGDPADVFGVWDLKPDGEEELSLRQDGTYTSHWDDGEDYFGEFSRDTSSGMLTTKEIRAIVTVSGNSITYDPPYYSNHIGTWSLTEPQLTIDFSGNIVVYTRV